MALVGNYSVYNKSPARWHGANATGYGSGICSGAVGKTRSAFNLPADWSKFRLQDEAGGDGSATVLVFASKPAGYRPGGAYGLASKTGGLSSYQARGTCTVVGAGALGKNAEASVAGDCTVTGSITGLAPAAGTAEGATPVTSLTAYAVGVLAGSAAGGCTATATAKAVLNGEGVAAGTCTVAGTGAATSPLTGTIAGSSTATGALTAQGVMAASAAGVGAATATVTEGRPISGTIAGGCTATLTAYARGLMGGSAAGVATANATRYALGNLAGTIAQATTLDAQIFASRLLDVEEVESGLTVRQLLRLTGAILGGEASGGGSAEMVYRNALADSKNRVVATVDNDGNRSVVTLDLD